MEIIDETAEQVDPPKCKAVRITKAVRRKTKKDVTYIACFTDNPKFVFVIWPQAISECEAALRNGREGDTFTLTYREATKNGFTYNNAEKLELAKPLLDQSGDFPF